MRFQRWIGYNLKTAAACQSKTFESRIFRNGSKKFVKIKAEKYMKIVGLRNVLCKCKVIKANITFAMNQRKLKLECFLRTSFFYLDTVF